MSGGRNLLAVESSRRPVTVDSATGVTDDPSKRGHTVPMKTEAEFVAKRREAHAAGTRDLDSDPLVMAALADRAAAVEVVKRWNSYREQTVVVKTQVKYRYKGGVRRQAD